MPRFYFDTDDGVEKQVDDVGIDLPTLETARRHAVSILPDIAREELPDGDRRVFVSKLRNEDGHTIFIATLSLIGEWVE